MHGEMYEYLAAIAVLFIAYYLSKNLLNVAYERVIFLLSLLKGQDNNATHISGDVYRVDYAHKGTRYSFYLPLREGGCGSDIYVAFGKRTLSIAQQSGVPYCITPKDFAEGAVVSVYVDDEPTNYIGEARIPH